MHVLFQAFHLQNGQNLQKVILRLLEKKKKGIQGSTEQKYQEHFQYQNSKFPDFFQLNQDLLPFEC